MRPFFPLFITILLQCSIHSQSQKNVMDSQIQLSLPMPGVLWELGSGKNTTLSLEAITGLALRGCTGCETEFGVYPILRGQYRYYYNMDRRLRKRKSIAGNSGNYLGVLIGYQNGNALIGSLDGPITNTLGIGPVYGLQRTYKRGFFYRLEAGVAYFEDDFSNSIDLVLAARIGWVLFRRK